MSSFDEQLALSSPPVPARSTELDGELARVIAQAEGSVVPRRRLRSRSVVIGSVVVLGALGAGGAAGAGLVPWFDSAPSRGVVSTSTGARCALTFGVRPVHDPAAPVSHAIRARVTAAAEEYLVSLDVSTLSVVQATLAASPRPKVDSESGPAMTVDDYEVSAVYDEVGRRLDAELDRQHLPAAVSLAMASSCGGGDR